jgi:cobalt-zinc-cadmium efflux system membrane fusion protein
MRRTGYLGGCFGREQESQKPDGRVIAMELDNHTPTARGRAFFWGGIVLGVIVLVALLTHGFGLLGSRAGGPEQAPALLRQGSQIIVPAGSALRERLTVLPAQVESVRAKLLLPAVVESDPRRTSTVLTPLSGRVLEVKVALGDRVTPGQVLAVIDSPDLAQAFDDDDKAADTLRLAQKNLERQEGQARIGAASDRDLDQARSDHRQAQAEYARTQARLRVLGISAESNDRSHLLTVRAPMAGSVIALSVARGNMINDPTQPMMTLADLSTIWVTALVAEKDLAAASKDQDADVVLAAYPDQILHGKVLFVADIIEPDSRRNKIRIAFANPDYRLKPNMFATVTLLGPAQTRIVVPSSALLMNNDRTSVFVATAPWTFERRSVDPQLEEGPSVAIRSGIQPGEQVVVKGGILLND